MDCYVKGKWLAAAEACISISERGFRFGDGVFETVRIAEGSPRHLQRHLHRMKDGLHSLRINKPTENMEEICAEILQRNNVIEGVLRISISRGIGSKGYLPTVTSPPTVVIETLPLPKIGAAPLTLWLSTTRKISGESLPMQHKLMQGINSTLARMEAADHGCDEALMLNLQGQLCEASSASLFWRDAEGVLHTPALECGPLAGISRQLLLEGWQGPLQQGHYTPEALKQATAVFITNAITGPQAVAKLEPLGYRWADTSLAQEARLIVEMAKKMGR